MKRLATCVVTCLSIAGAGYAGEVGDLWFGVRGGPSIPRLSGGNNEVSRGYSSIVAPNAALVAEYYLAPSFSLLLELNYSGQGGERKGRQPMTQTPQGLPGVPPGQLLYADFDNRSVLNYLEIPLMGKYEWSYGERWRSFVELGPFVGFLLNAKEETRGTSPIYLDANGTPLTIGDNPLPPVSLDADTNIKDDLRKVNVGLTGGAGMAYLLNPNNRIFVDLRGQYGLIPVQKNTLEDGRSYAGNLVLSVGYMFMFGR